MANPSSSSSSSHSHLIIEEREELMVSAKGHTFIKTHFLKPSSVSVSSLPLQRHYSVSSSSSSSHSELLKILSSRQSISGFWVADRSFISWVGKMEALHEPTWRKAGIFEAIKASTYNITKDSSLLLSVSEKWFPETNSFIFPWGEATITLEDVNVLLGFSVLGSPVLASVESSEKVEKLVKAWQEIKDSNIGCVTVERWTSSFFGRGDLEHEAFLALWLSLYVFPQRSRRGVSKRVVHIAVRLARGERIALAPAVLAGVYRDLCLLKGFVCGGKLNLRSLLKLVQVWTWERFKNLRLKARDIPKGEPRIAQWDSLQRRYKNVGLGFDDFEWRPYTKPLKNWNPLRVYVEEAMWVTVDNSVLDDEFASFARCVRVSHLAGDGFVESYYPNRVAMQFGLAQDLPGLVTGDREFTEKEAWDDYNKCLDGLKLYMPSRLARGSVTARYRDWWLKETAETLNDSDDDDNVSPKVFPLSQVVKKLEEGLPATRTRSSMRRLANKDKIGELVNSLAHEDDNESSMDEEDDNMTIVQRMRCRKKCSDEEKAGEDASEPLGKRRRKFQVMDSDDSGPCLEKRNEEYDETASNIQQKTRQICDDEVYANADTAGKRSMIIDETKKADANADTAGQKSMIVDEARNFEAWLHEEREKKRCREKRREDILERLKQRNLAIKEKELELEARIMEVEKTLAKIKIEASA